jgi:ATP/maltotriose-dependent transcriptional regulator MalT
MTEALELLRSVTTRLGRKGGDGARNYPRLCLAGMLTALGEFDEAEAVIAQCRIEIEVTGDSMWAAAPSLARASVRLAAGRLDDADAEAEIGLAIAGGLGNEFFVEIAECARALIALQRGDVDTAAERLARCPAGAPPSGVTFGFLGPAWARAQLAGAQDDPAGALAALASVTGEVDSYKGVLIDQPVAAPWLVRIALQGDVPALADAVVGRAELTAARNPELATVVASALHARALRDRDPSKLEDAATRYRHPRHRAAAWEDAGSILAESHRDAARKAFERALTAYEEGGAAADVERVRRRLRDLATAHRRRRHADPPRWGWVSLTASERGVAGAVAEGLTNAEVGGRMFLSRHTVDFHLRQIYRKLGIKSRVELTRLVLEHDQDDVDGALVTGGRVHRLA